MRKTILMLSPLLIVALFFGVIYYLYCNALRIERMDRVVRSLLSPNKLYNAILVESHTGAVGYTQYWVYIKPVGENLSDKELSVFGAKRLRGENIYWADANNLIIEYKSADIFSFRNYLHLKLDDQYNEIRIKEVCTKNK